MRKKTGEIFEPIKVDPISGEYFIVIPESFINEFSWYEDTEISLKIEGNEIILSERSH